MADDGFARTLMACNVVLRQSGKYLLVLEGQGSHKGQWNLPGGRVDEGETLEQTAIREAKEETGFEVSLKRQLLVYHRHSDRPVLHSYEAEIIGGSLQIPPEEMDDAKWFTYEEILELRSQSCLRNDEYIMLSLQELGGGK